MDVNGYECHCSWSDGSTPNCGPLKQATVATGQESGLGLSTFFLAFCWCLDLLGAYDDHPIYVRKLLMLRVTQVDLPPPPKYRRFSDFRVVKLVPGIWPIPRRFSDYGRWLYSINIVSTLLGFMYCTNIYKDTYIHNIHHIHNIHIHYIHIHNLSCFPYWNQTYQWRFELSDLRRRWWQRHGLPSWTADAGLGVCAVPPHRRPWFQYVPITLW